MKVNVKTLKEKINEVRVDTINLAISNVKNDIFGDKKEEALVEELFNHISEAPSLENYIWETIDDFCNKNISVEEVFSCRKNSVISDIISEIIAESNNTLESSSVSAIDKVLNMACFRYMLLASSNIEKELLQVYLLDNLYCILLDFDNNLELDASEYGDYNDEESLLDEFIDELISGISGDERIIQIEDNAKDALNEFFQLEV